MPPLPPTFDEETTQLISNTRRREIDINEIQIPRLRACPGPLSLQQKLSAELREDVDAFARQVEALGVMVDDQKGEKNRRELNKVVNELKETLIRIRKEYRTAMVTSKRTIDTSSMSNRSELLTSTAVKDRRDVNEKVTEDAVMQANNDVTEALQRTLGLMQGELERSVLATQMLDSSIATLRATSSTHDMLTSAMDTSKQLITALQKADWIDRLILFFGLGVFFLVTLFILKQRVLDKSVRIAFWWTRFLPSPKPAVSVVSSVIATSSTALAPSLASSVASAVSTAASITSAIVASSLSATSEADVSGTGTSGIPSSTLSVVETATIAADSPEPVPLHDAESAIPGVSETTISVVDARDEL